jgi:hypothetical protein
MADEEIVVGENAIRHKTTEVRHRCDATVTADAINLTGFSAGPKIADAIKRETLGMIQVRRKRGRIFDRDLRVMPWSATLGWLRRKTRY